ncbi:MAG: diguanylate cyclase [Acidobacteria bacterium]|nr:diguanylate cyclase [Acidobacteriota bacterium]NIM64237.1 diguanylate cyclase [Acidobacteriota bacterium]NIO59235.1 diguanylate cyclase [Acidobacteriota bacterium]NIQ30262.1 diguanylate cyclase [Acidobacteriota bacterium]NIQ85190.1 diguanylate cyclase [Acidobacteriota bacterium]
MNAEPGEVLREQLLAILTEDAHNAKRLNERLDSLASETGVGAYAALLLILTRKSFPDDEAQLHWKLIVERQREMSEALSREVGVRVAAFDYFIHVNRQLVQPALIDIELLESSAQNATLDPLTGLASERTFRSAVSNELRRSRRYALNAAVVLFDLDDFAAVNDRLGALVADRILREASMLINNKVRDIDLVARCGSDELVLLLPETDRNGALLVAERCRAAIEGFFAAEGASRPAIHLTVSGGIAAYPSDAQTPEDLLAGAARALYQAKAAGKNLVELHQDERRRYLRFDLEPGLFEVEVLARGRADARPLLNLSQEGLLFASPEAIDVGERIELRLAGAGTDETVLRGSVVRLEVLPEHDPAASDRFDIGVVFDEQTAPSRRALLTFLECARAPR